MCPKAITGLLSGVMGGAPKEASAPAVQASAPAESSPTVKIQDDSTAYDRTSGGARVGGGGRKKAKRAEVPGLGL